MVWTMPFRAQWGARLLLHCLDVAWADTQLLRWAVHERLPDVDDPHCRGLLYIGPLVHRGLLYTDYLFFPLLQA